MTLFIEILVSALLIIGGLFGLIGSFGLLKLRQPMQRLHAPTKATTVGVGASLIASSLSLYHLTGAVTWHQLLVMVFLFLTAPLSALLLAKAHQHTTINRADLPKTGTGAPWAGDPQTPDA
jgi:multicomponent K+:H+ antiporter subunit G